MSYLLLLITLFSCKSYFEETQEELEIRCMPVLENIVRIQNHRDIARKDFDLTLLDYTSGRISEETWQNERSVWLERESQLAGDVESALYLLL